MGTKPEEVILGTLGRGSGHASEAGLGNYQVCTGLASSFLALTACALVAWGEKGGWQGCRHGGKKGGWQGCRSATVSVTSLRER
jgi:hypothetical protein